MKTENKHKNSHVCKVDVAKAKAPDTLALKEFLPENKSPSNLNTSKINPQKSCYCSIRSYPFPSMPRRKTAVTGGAI